MFGFGSFDVAETKTKFVKERRAGARRLLGLILSSMVLPHFKENVSKADCSK